MILTTSDSGAGNRARGFRRRFWDAVRMGELSSQIKLDTWLASRSDKPETSESHWLDNTGWWLKEARAGEGLVEFCERFDAIRYGSIRIRTSS
jgi:hypothetical protein